METAHGEVASVNQNGVYSFTKPARDAIVLVAGLGVEGDTHAGVHVRHRSRVKADPAQPNLRQVHLIHEELFADVARKGYDVRPGNLGENVTTRGLALLDLPVGTILRFGPPPESANHPESADRAGNSGRDEAAGNVLAGVLGAAAAATLNEPTARAAEALRAALAREEAAEQERGPDSRPALVVAGLRNPCQQINNFRPGLLKEVIAHDEHGGLVRKGGIMAVVLRGGVVRPGDAITAEFPPSPHARLEPV
ncbi:MOSC domain-containing protein [Paractinoplanes hotanensis]|uniref:Transcription elongation factor n=1 Tax=Paractinoplanes hotanensis TaxID=2906497 RepID=A0ABT0Y3G0_9ACTN|nr:MOSC domain-containing protein [Actinoplanes hotanensis]MCM4080578.1 transcription elongation factor [Actinoplanes hotanensis]